MDCKSIVVCFYYLLAGESILLKFEGSNFSGCGEFQFASVTGNFLRSDFDRATT